MRDGVWWFGSGGGGRPRRRWPRGSRIGSIRFDAERSNAGGGVQLQQRVCCLPRPAVTRTYEAMQRATQQARRTLSRRRQSERTGGSEGRPASQSKQLKKLWPCREPACLQIRRLVLPWGRLGWQAKAGPGAADNCSPARETKDGRKEKNIDYVQYKSDGAKGIVVSSVVVDSSVSSGCVARKKEVSVGAVFQALEGGWPRLQVTRCCFVGFGRRSGRTTQAMTAVLHCRCPLKHRAESWGPRCLCTGSGRARYLPPPKFT